jgi:hypothetical protein
MSIGGGRAGARSAVGVAGFGFCTLGVAGWVRAAGRAPDASGSVGAAAGTVASNAGAVCTGVVRGLALAVAAAAGA